MDEATAPEPVSGLIVYDPAFATQRWRVNGIAADDRIEAVRVEPDDGVRHSWDRAGWERAWRKGWLAPASREGRSDA